MTIAALTSIISGNILYRGAGGIAIGRERFELAGHAGGHVLRAFCEMDDIGLLRDVTLSLDEAWRPLDAFCRITRAGVVEAAVTGCRRLCGLAGVSASDEHAMATSATAGKIALCTQLYCRTVAPASS